ncbi:hypothetical protein KEJ50_00570 [Candidatus Bathyarchaeota archaeon]|nr:hypothetical protein [Candidatus Bathyarchaeota archaeon]
MVLKTFAGGSFMKVFNAWYYSFSPEIASFISKSPTEIVGSRDGYHILIASFISKFPTLKLLTRIFIYPLIGILTLASLAYRLFAFNPELAITITGLIASGFIGIVYFTPITLLTIYPLKHKALKNKRKILTYAFTFWLISFPMMIIAEAFKAELIMKIASSMLVLTTITLSAVGLSFILLKFIKNRFFR